MRKLFTLLLVSFVLASCSSSDKHVTEELKVEIKVGATFDLPNDLYDTVAGANEFVATISEEGKIKGIHAGNTKAIVKTEDTTYKLDIKVEANSTFYVDLGFLININADKKAIEGLYGEPDAISEKGYYIYKSVLLENSQAFSFDEDGKIDMALINFSTTYSKRIGEHLADRYKLYTTSASSIMYIDANTYEESNIGVLVSIDAREIGVFYARKDAIAADKLRSFRSAITE